MRVANISWPATASFDLPTRRVYPTYSTANNRQRFMLIPWTIYTREPSIRQATCMKMTTLTFLYMTFDLKLAIAPS